MHRTLQECILATRCLIIGAQQVFFQCNCVVCCESLDELPSLAHKTCLENSVSSAGESFTPHISLLGNIFIRGSFSRSVGQTISPQQNDIKGKRSSVGKPGMLGSIRNLFKDNGTSVYDRYTRTQLSSNLQRQAYVGLLKNYTTRNLSHAEDAIRAMSGLLNRLTRYAPVYQSGFHWGLPEEALQETLGWQLKPGFKNDQVKARYREGFPSWSWVAWAHEISLDSFDTKRTWRDRNFNSEQKFWKYSQGTFMPCLPADGQRPRRIELDLLPDAINREHLLCVEGLVFDMEITNYDKAQRRLAIRSPLDVSFEAELLDPNTRFWDLEAELMNNTSTHTSFLPLYIGRQSLNINSQGMTCIVLQWMGEVAFRAGLVQIDSLKGDIYTLLKGTKKRTILLA